MPAKKNARPLAQSAGDQLTPAKSLGPVKGGDRKRGRATRTSLLQAWQGSFTPSQNAAQLPSAQPGPAPTRAQLNYWFVRAVSLHNGLGRVAPSDQNVSPTPEDQWRYLQATAKRSIAKPHVRPQPDQPLKKERDSGD